MKTTTTSWISCPECGRSDALATRERVPGTCSFTPLDDGSMEYDDETDMDWDGQETIKNEAGELLFVCLECNREWYQALPGQGGGA